MTQAEVMDMMRQMLLVCIQIAGPILLVSMAVGLIISILQAATQIQEQTLTFVPKVLVTALVLLLLGGWISTTIITFVERVFAAMAMI